MSTVEINPEWFRQYNKKNINSSRNEETKTDLNSELDIEISKLSSRDQELFNLIMTKNKLSIKKLEPSRIIGRSTPVSFYNFSKNLSILGLSYGLFGLNLFNKGYILAFTSRNITYSICNIDKETIDAFSSIPILRYGKKFSYGLISFLITVMIMIFSRACTHQVLNYATAPTRAEVIEKLKNESNKNLEIESEDVKVVNYAINAKEEVEIKVIIKNYKRSQIDLSKIDLSVPQGELYNYYCHDSRMKMTRDYKIPVNYKYYSIDNKFLYEIYIDNNKCS